MDRNGHFYETFVAPFQSRQRATVFATQFMGALAAGFLEVFMAIDMLRFGMEGMLTYFVVRFGLAGVVLFPIFTWLYLSKPRAWFLGAIFLVQALSLAPFFYAGILTSPFLIGLCAAGASAGYWQSFHLVMSAHTSDKKRGYEVSLSQIIQTAGGIAGYLAAGVAAAMELGSVIMLAGFALQLCVTAVFSRSIPKPRQSEEILLGHIQATRLWDEIAHHPRRAILTVIDAVYGSVTGILFPSWLKIMGIAAFSVGMVSAIRVAIQALAAPLTGKLYADDKKRELEIGGATGFLGWLPWCFTLQPWTLAWSIPLWSCTTIFVATGLSGRWYHQRSATAILLREFLLTVGRLLTAGITIPLMFLHPNLFAYVGAAVSLMMLFLAGRMRHGR